MVGAKYVRQERRGIWRTHGEKELDLFDSS